MADPQHPDIAALVACPFCGGNAHLRERYSVMAGADRFQVQCGECYCGTSDRYERPDYAVAAWNNRTLTRPGADEEVRQLDALRAEFDQLFGRFTDESARATRAEQEAARLRGIVRDMDGELRLAHAALQDDDVTDGLAHVNDALHEAERALAAAAGTEEPR